MKRSPSGSVRRLAARTALILLAMALLVAASACREKSAPVSPLAPAAVPVPGAGRVKSGLEVLMEKRLDLIRGRKIGLITNPSAVD
ncbi:MAG: hypothetical protein ABSA30_14975, partial [Candidatus Aminicenantales bacterium]